MSFYTLSKNLTGEVPKTPLSLARTKITEALNLIYDSYDWSFKTQYAGWLTPGQLANQGTFTTTPYFNQVTADAVATQAVLSIQGNPLLTTLQYRDPSRAIYNIVNLSSATTVAYLTIFAAGAAQTPGIYTYPVQDAGGPGAGATVAITVNPDGTVTLPPVVLTTGTGYTNPFVIFAEGGAAASFIVVLNAILTLDRPWMEPTTGPGQPYMIYQAYFVAPVPDFEKFLEVRDTTNIGRLDFWSYSQADLALRDPQRTEYDDPDYVVPYGFDQRPGSSTLGYQMFELWPQQLSMCPYSFSYKRRGPAPNFLPGNDTTCFPPYPITEEMVSWRSKEVLYQFKEAQKEKEAVRGSGANWILLSQMAKKEYDACLEKVQARDINMRNDAVSHVEDPRWQSNQPFSNRLGQLNVGRYPQ